MLKRYTNRFRHRTYGLSPAATRPQVDARAVAIALAASIGLTVAAVPLAWHLRMTTGIDDVVLAISGKPPKIDPQAVAQRLASEAEVTADLDRLARETVTELGPEAILPVTQIMLAGRGKASQRLAVLMLENGATRFQHATLLVRAGFEYWVGRYVERDFDKAMRYLSDPVTAILPSAHYFLGRVYLDARNPAHDRARGLEALRRAADMGLKPARDLLAREAAQEAG